jgi:hypothetical protein
MNWEGRGRKQPRPVLKYYPSIFIEELKKKIYDKNSNRIWFQN